MTALPITTSMPVIRTDFTDRATWDTVRAAIVAPSEDDFVANVEFVDDPALADLTAEQLLELATEEAIGYQRCLLVVDRITTASDGWPRRGRRGVPRVLMARPPDATISTGSGPTGAAIGRHA